MSHINYNHLYYFWHVYKEGSVVGAAEALFLTPQTITGQIKALEERLQGKLFKRKGRGLEPSELGELVFRYADKMFTLSQEMLDIVNYRKESNLLFDVGVADALFQASGQQRSGCGGGGGRTHTSALLRVHARNVARTAQPAQAGYDYLRLPDRFHAAGGAILSQNRRMQRQFLVYESAS